MGISEDIMEKLKAAMKAKDQVALGAIRALKNAILVEERSGDAQHQLSEDQKLAIVQKQVRQRQESSQIYRDQGRNDLADNEDAEIAVLSGFLPSMLSESELRDIVTQVIAETSATSVKDLGRVMQAVRARVGARAEGKVVADMVKALLK